VLLARDEERVLLLDELDLLGGEARHRHGDAILVVARLLDVVGWPVRGRGRLIEHVNDSIDPDYVYWNLRATRERYGFDRVFRASLTNVRAEVELTIPVDPSSGSFDLDAQRAMAAQMRALDQTREAVNTALEELVRGRIRVEDLSL
jgi:hypothetical protein